MDDCRAQVLIVDAMADRSFQAYTGQKISFDAFEQDTAKEDHHTPKTEKDDFAYIMYTSGSMGKCQGGGGYSEELIFLPCRIEADLR